MIDEKYTEVAGLLAGAGDVTRLIPIVKEVNIRFRRPATTDVTMQVELAPEEASRIEAEALDQGKADFVLNLELLDANREVVAIVGGTWQVRAIQQGMPVLAPNK